MNNLLEITSRLNSEMTIVLCATNQMARTWATNAEEHLLLIELAGAALRVTALTAQLRQYVTEHPEAPKGV